jgi:hypothetical protein
MYDYWVRVTWMVRRAITLEIGMIDGNGTNVRDDFYYEGLNGEATLRIHESLFYDMAAVLPHSSRGIQRI